MSDCPTGRHVNFNISGKLLIFFRFTVYNTKQYETYFSAVIIDNHVFFQKHLGTKNKKRNKLMIWKEVTLTCFVKSLSEA